MKTIIHVVDVAVPRERIFEALTTVDGLAAWWTTKVAGDAGPGGLIDFTFDGQVFNPDMRVTEHSAPSLVGWRCVGGVDQWADNTFRFELAPRDVATRVRFRQDYAAELSDDEYGIYNYNWAYYLESLRLHCETGTGKPFQAGVEVTS
jgi:uncharacterized protein YndB with AHSA1/START domain